MLKSVVKFLCLIPN